ncbi:MAG: response regulator, partial [Aureliella sp.]
MAKQNASFNAADILVFVVDDDPDTRLNLRDILEMDGYTVADAASAAELFALPGWDRVSVILLDRKLPDSEPEVILPQILQEAPQASVMVVTGYADVDSAVSALRHGAADYIIKPINPEALLASVRREVAHQRSERQLRALYENALSGVLMFDNDGMIVDANPAACLMLRMEQQDLLGRAVNSLMEGEESGEPSEDIASPHSAYGEVKLRRSDGTVIDVERQTMLNFSPGLSAVALRDVTEKKQSERRALQAERLAAIG